MYRQVRTDDGVIESEDVLYHKDGFDNDASHGDLSLECETVQYDASAEVNCSYYHWLICYFDPYSVTHDDGNGADNDDGSDVVAKEVAVAFLEQANQVDLRKANWA